MAAGIQFDVSYGRMVCAFQAKESQLFVLVFERSIAIATIAMADQMITDRLNDSLHFGRLDK